jgi:hypothetical protein
VNPTACQVLTDGDKIIKHSSDGGDNEDYYCIGEAVYEGVASLVVISDYIIAYDSD